MVEIVVGLVALVVVVVVPLASLVRMIRLQDDVRALRLRIDRLERERSEARVTPPPPPPPPPRPAVQPSALPLPPVAAPPVFAARAVPVPDTEPETLESQIGGKLLLYAGMLVLVIGLAFFLKYAFEHEWMSPPVRVALGVVIGLALVAGGYRLATAYRAYGLFLAGGGVAVLYLSVYAALNFYELIPQAPAFVLLVAITVGGALLADRTGSQSLALMAACGGFLVPFLVGRGEDAQITLFTYDALLVAATMFLAHRQDWPWLNVASLVFTGLTVVAWADSYYTPDKYLRTEFFLTVYCAMFVAMGVHSLHSGHQHGRLVAGVLAAAPVTYYLASIVILMPYGLALPIFLIAITLVAVIGSLHFQVPALRLLAWVAVALPLSSWVEDHQSGPWIVGAVTTIVAIHLVHLVAQLRSLSRGKPDTFEIVLLHANGIGLFAGLYETLLTRISVPQQALLALAIAAVNAGIWFSARRINTETALQWAGVAFTLVGIAVALQFDGPWAVAMWATEAVAVAWVAVRTNHDWFRIGAAALFALAIQRWFQPDVQEVIVGQTAVANSRALAGMFVVALLYVVALFQRAEPESRPTTLHERAGVLIAASALTVAVMSKEIWSYWEAQITAGEEAYVARELMLSAAWAAYAALLVVVGIRLRYAPIRYFAIALFGLTLAKVFIVDLETVGGIYRVAGFVVIGVILLLVSFMYQRDRIAGGRQAGGP
jgi:uncharacterized membrane protein